jgi:peptide subunit release factor RF-3
MAYFVKSTRSIGLTQSVLHFNFKSGLAINILALEGSLPFFLDNYHPLKLYANP